MGRKIKYIYSNMNKLVFWICLSTSIILIVVGFLLPPLAEISGSVLTAVGELFGYATLGTVLEGIHRGADIKLSKGNTSIEIDNPDN